jgi:hypothetical protein
MMTNKCETCAFWEYFFGENVMEDSPIDQMCRMFVEKKRLVLLVEVNSTDEAEELLRWMYAKEKPMKSTLLEVAWDKAIVTEKAADALEMLREALNV